MAESIEPIFLRACRGEPTERTPVWLMRQAGRYMANYRALREKHSLLEMVKSPELACEVTMQPINAFDLDAAIIFADILPLLEVFGFEIEFLQGEGPRITGPLHEAKAVENLQARPITECLHFTLDAISLVRKELASKNIPLIGFSGAPFTLASYAIEGGSSKDHRATKEFMYRHPKHWNMLMQKLSRAIAEYLVAQANAGAQALQIFDSWAGSLSPHDYANFVLPHLHAIMDHVRSQTKVPLIYFSTGTGAYLSEISALDVDVVGVDWRVNLNEAWQEVGTKSLQGNLDPVTLFGPKDALETQAKRILAEAKAVRQDRRGFIFNLGHGILPKTPEDNVKHLIDVVHCAT